MHFTCLGSHLLLLRLISCFPFAFCHAKVQLPACSPWGGPSCPVSLLPPWETQTSPRSPQLQLAPDAASRESASNLPSVLLPNPTQTKVAKVTHWKLSCRKPRSPIAGRKAVGGRHGARAAGGDMILLILLTRSPVNSGKLLNAVSVYSSVLHGVRKSE